jgi:hypothetical protein
MPDQNAMRGALVACRVIIMKAVYVLYLRLSQNSGRLKSYLSMNNPLLILLLYSIWRDKARLDLSPRQPYEAEVSKIHQKLRVPTSEGSVLFLIPS